MKEPKPLPCPFCGSEPKVVNAGAVYWVRCAGNLCPASPRVGGGIKEEAIQAWNTRHTPEIPNLWGDLSDTAPKVDKQLEKDLVDIRWASEHECGRIGSIARTILHLLKR